MDTNHNEHDQTDLIVNKEIAPKKKRWWTLTKAIIGYVIPFLIVGGIVGGIYYLVFTERESESEILDQRQEALEENWKEYLLQAEDNNREILLSNFELTLCPFAEDETTWDEYSSPEEGGMICGNVTVPLYHNQPEGETIQIPIVIWPYPEETENPDPLFIMQGGPGGSTLDIYPDWFYGNRPGGEREIVFVDQRGTRYSKPSLECNEEDESEEDVDLVKEKDEEDREENNDEYLAYLTACQDRLVSEGVDFNAFNTAEIAHDMESVRLVFDYPEINFYGVSYGSHIAQYLAAYHPGGLRSLILDGVAPIPLNYLDKTYFHANRLLEDYLKECQENTDCTQKYPELVERITGIIDQLDEKPVSITLHDPKSSDSITEEIDGEEFLYYLIFIFRMDSSYANLPYLISQAENGRFDLYKWYSEMLTFEEVDSDGLYYAVVSGEHTPLLKPDRSEYFIPKLSEIEIEEFEENLQEFDVWEVTPSTEILSEMPSSSVPALLMSGYYDPATPPEYGEITLKSFLNGQHVIDPVGGHGIAFDDDCTENILINFLEEPKQAVDSECLADEGRIDKLLEPEAISAPFLAKNMENEDFFYLSWFIPPIIFLVMVLRGSFQHLRILWQRNRGSTLPATPHEKLIHLRFELSSWFTILAGLIYLIILNANLFSLPDNSAYFISLAVPANTRGILFIVVLLTFLIITEFISAIQLWRYRKKVFARTYILFQVVFSGFFLAYLIWTGLLWAWMR